MKRLLNLTLIIALTITGNAQNLTTKADQFFKKYVSEGLVDYNSIVRNPDLLDECVDLIANTDTESMKDAEKKAFWINSYNLLVINQLVNNWPATNPLNISGFFKENKFEIGGEKITLDYLENELLRKIYHDPRIHFVLVCGAKGCPKIAPFAYTAEKVDAQMQDRTVLALNDPNFIKVNDKKKSVKISEIFYWFQSDFKMKGHTYISFINEFRETKIPDSYSVDKYLYDWDVNKKKSFE